MKFEGANSCHLLFRQFQNHRNRAKKDGRPLRRLNSGPLPLKLSLESVEKKMPFFMIPENERNDSTESSHVEPADDAEEESFGPTQNEPPFTFNMAVPYPTPHPLSCTYDSFPRKHTFPAPMWTRKPAISLPRRPAVDFEDFMLDFAGKLVLREPSSKKHTDEHR